MTQELSIAVCIPTYKRLDLLLEALTSCLAQTHLPQEILIGDNSPDTQTEAYIKELAHTTAIPIRYRRHVPSLSQTQNVDDLFERVQSDILVLLHDDDTLVPDCLEHMHACFTQHPDIDVAYGKQYIMSNKGEIDYPASAKLNKTFYRTASYAGTVLTSVESAMLQQFPNDAFAIRAAVAKKLGYDGQSNHACDFEFALKVALAGHKIYFINHYTASYRLSADALSNNLDNNGALVIFQLVEALQVPAASAHYQAEVLKDKAPVAIAQAANRKQPREALRIFFSKWHARNIFSISGLKGVYHVLEAFL